MSMNYTKHLTFLAALLLVVNVAKSQSSVEEKKVFINNEATINTDKLEYSPAFLEDGIVFISSKYLSKKFKVKDKRIDKNIMSIYHARREESGLLQVPIHFANELTTTVHEGPLTFDRTADRVFFTRNNVKNGKRKKAKDGIVKLKIYTSERVSDKWMNVEELSFNDDESNTCHPAISVDGDILYFASDRPGSLGGMDIWMSKKSGDMWGEPINLGPEINTEADEVFPFAHADGSLFFASSGHAGFGGLDVFFSNRNGEGWNKPTNLKAPFNSENDDFGYIIDRDKKNGYFSSNRPGGFGEDDIYSFYVSGNLDELFNDKDKPKEIKNFNLLVTDAATGDIVEGAKITYTNLDELNIANAITEQGKTTSILQLLSEENKELLLRVPLDANSQNGLTDNWGKFPLSLNEGNYVLIVEQEGFTPHQMVVDTDREELDIFVSLNTKPEESMANNDNGNNNSSTNPNNGGDGTGSNGSAVDAPTFNTGTTSDETSFPSTIKEGTVFQLPNIYYNFNDAKIRPDARIDLDALADFLQNYPDIEIELSSHTDSRGGTRYNRKLSQGRADNAVKYLIGRGLSSSRLTPVGYGEEQIRNHCTDGKDCSEEEHQYNRRTEVRITKMSQEINIQFVNESSPPSTYTEPSNEYTSSTTSTSYDTDNQTVRNIAYLEQFTVVAGVFGEYKNAQKRLNKLYDLGFGGAEIVAYGSANRYSVIVRQCDNMQEAKALKRTLRKEHRIKSFVKS